MNTDFQKPDFSTGDLELRFVGGVVCIYGTANGLKRLISLCESLVECPEQGHVHLENYGILTQKSEKGAISIFSLAGK